MSLLQYSSRRRPPPLQDADYDHEIVLEDHTRNSTPRASRSRSAGDQHLSPTSDSSSRRHSDVPLYKHQSPMHLREELTRRKYAKYQERGSQKNGVLETENEVAGAGDDITGVDGEEERGRTRDSKSKPRKDPETAIDILYENQRGGFMCGLPLFSSRALGNLDPAPWTNIASKTSATNITNAQVPDPSWEWVWKDWSVNHTEEVDEDGWEYSFMFSKKFSWHGPSWWNSFVRRRAWIRKRAKRNSGYQADDSHMMNADYFTIHSAQIRSTSRISSGGGSFQNRYSTVSLSRRDVEQEIDVEDISDIGSLLKALRLARIDREKTEAVESFIKNGGDDLYYLRDHMHDIMHMFIFQASRRSLLAHLLQILNETTEQLKDNVDDDEGSKLSKKKRIEYLEAAVKCADEEVKRLEFWSDMKEIAEKGLSKGAVDESQGWGKEWTGLDDSGPKDVLSDPVTSGKGNCNDDNGIGSTSKQPESRKGKEKE